MQVNIRAATRGDLFAWSKMRAELWPHGKNSHLSELEAYFEGTSNDIVQAYVIELKSSLIGFIELNIRNFAEGSRNTPVPYVEGWYISPEHRGNGYGKQLMKKAEQWARSQGFEELASDTTLDNHKSIEIHKRMGFIETDRIVCFLKKLS